MTGMNCSVNGTLIREPKMGTTKNGKQFVNMKMSYSEFNGQTNDCLINAYGQTAIAVAQKLQIGQQVHVEGALFLLTRENKDTQTAELSINANKIEAILSQQDDNSTY